jgi:hypothetical protein
LSAFNYTVRVHHPDHNNDVDGDYCGFNVLARDGNADICPVRRTISRAFRQPIGYPDVVPHSCINACSHGVTNGPVRDRCTVASTHGI